MRTSLQTVANHLGLSRSTVSRALRQHPRIPAETRRRVEAACQKLGYRAHAVLSELASSHWEARKEVGGNVIAFIDRTRLGGKLGVNSTPAQHKQAAQLGYDIVTFRRQEFSSSARLQTVLRNRGITDVILGSMYEQEFSVELDWSRFISVQLLPGSFQLPLHSVVKDFFGGVVLAWQKAVERGYQRIGVTLLDHPTLLNHDIIRASAVHACQKHHFPHLEAIPPFHYSAADARVKDFVRWIETNRVDVLIGFSDLHYFCFQQAFGRDIPFVVLHKTDTRGISGIPDASDVCAKEAINLLHFCRRTHQWGIPEQRIDHVVEPTWYEGETLPWCDRSSR